VSGLAACRRHPPQNDRQQDHQKPK
jgi:hypothetical protein